MKKTPKLSRAVIRAEAARSESAPCYFCGNPKWRHFVVGGPDMIAHSFKKNPLETVQKVQSPL